MLLQKERKAMHALRDDQGRSLLDMARTTRGKVEKLVALLESLGVPATT